MRRRVCVPPARSGVEDLNGMDLVEGEPLEVILQAIEDESDVMIIYAGARGVTDGCVSPIEIEGSAVHAFCHLRNDEHRFWAGSILAAAARGD